MLGDVPDDAGLTCAELATLLDLAPKAVRTRLDKLVEDGKVVKLEKSIQMPSGRWAALFKLAPDAT